VNVLVTNNVMKNTMGPWCRARLMTIVVGLGFSTSALAEPLPFVGRWLADDAAASPYTTLTVKGDTLLWHGPDKSVPKCTRQFAVQPEKPGTVYVNAHGTKFIAGFKGSIPTYLLQLDGGTCGNASSAVRINYPLIYDTQHIELIEYAGGKPVGAQRFHRKK
jgi:hypothetical protein